MQLDERLYKAFLEEMQELENFRITYTAMHPHISLERDDPDVKRLIEAMAFFAARTHMAGTRNIVTSRRRIFQQFFPFLLAPKPAMGIVQAKPTGQFVETALLPRGSEIAVSPVTGGTAIFRTLGDLRILPISLMQIDMLPLPGKGFRLLMRLKTPYPRSDQIGQLSFHINHINDFLASLRVHHLLKKYIQRASVVFGEEIHETTRGTPCEISFGLPQEDENEECPHPLQREQLFYHFPQQHLFLNIKVPSSPRNWSRFTIILDLDAQWPKNLRLNKDVFQLFAIPMINLKRAMAQPLIYDGTRERYPIRYAEQGKGFELHSVTGVYKIEQQAMIPIRTGIISGGNGSYEIEYMSDKKGRNRQWLILHFPEAFQNPQTIAIEGLWLQPWFSEAVSQRLQIIPYSRNIAGLEWELLGGLVPHEDNTFKDEMDDFLHLLTLKNKSILNIDDLTVMLQTLGCLHQGNFHRLVRLLTGVRVEETATPQNGTKGMLKLVYYLQFKELDPGLQPLAETFIDHVSQILDAWISEAKVEAQLEILGAKK